MALVLTAAPLAAQPTGRLAGKVIDEQDGALPGVVVTVSSANLMGTRSAQTDIDGEFSFPALPPGTYNVVAELEGFITQEFNQVEIRLGRTSEIQWWP